MPVDRVFVVTVTFHVADGFRDAFRDAILENAATSLEVEPGCSVFDVCANKEGAEIFLYEVYNSETSFKEHLASAHFIRFDALVAPWVVDKRVVTYARLH